MGPPRVRGAHSETSEKHAPSCFRLTFRQAPRIAAKFTTHTLQISTLQSNTHLKPSTSCRSARSSPIPEQQLFEVSLLLRARGSNSLVFGWQTYSSLTGMFWTAKKRWEAVAETRNNQLPGAFPWGERATECWQCVSCPQKQTSACSHAALWN